MSSFLEEYQKEMDAKLELAGINTASLSKHEKDLVLEPQESPESYYQDGELSESQAWQNWLRKIYATGMSKEDKAKAVAIYAKRSFEKKEDGGRLKSALMRDRKYTSKQEWEKKYNRVGPKKFYKEEGGNMKTPPAVVKVDVMYRDGANYKKFVEDLVVPPVYIQKNGLPEEGDDITMEDLGFTPKEFYDLAGVEYDEDIDHNILEVTGVKSGMASGGGLSDEDFEMVGEAAKAGYIIRPKGDEFVIIDLKNRSNTGVLYKTHQLAIQALRKYATAVPNKSSAKPSQQNLIESDRYYADGGVIPWSVGEGMGTYPALKDVKIADLDPYEQQVYHDFEKHGHGFALQLIINNVEGDYTQLSPKLRKIAEAQEAELSKSKKLSIGDTIPELGSNWHCKGTSPQNQTAVRFSHSSDPTSHVDIDKSFLAEHGYDVEQFATGGILPNGYAGKTPKEIWDMWSARQRLHFITDHLDDDERSLFIGRGYDILALDYDQIPNEPIAKGQTTSITDILKKQIGYHVKNGQYQTGGGVWTSDQAKKVAILDQEFETLLSEKKIEPHSKAASDLWHKEGFSQRMKKIFEPDSEIEIILGATYNINIPANDEDPHGKQIKTTGVVAGKSVGFWLVLAPNGMLYPFYGEELAGHEVLDTIWEYKGKKYPVRHLVIEGHDLEGPTEVTIATESLEKELKKSRWRGQAGELDEQIYFYVPDKVMLMSDKDVAANLDEAFTIATAQEKNGGPLASKKTGNSKKRKQKEGEKHFSDATHFDIRISRKMAENILNGDAELLKQIDIMCKELGDGKNWGAVKPSDLVNKKMPNVYATFEIWIQGKITPEQLKKQLSEIL